MFNLDFQTMTLTIEAATTQQWAVLYGLGVAALATFAWLIR